MGWLGRFFNKGDTVLNGACFGLFARCRGLHEGSAAARGTPWWSRPAGTCPTNHSYFDSCPRLIHKRQVAFLLKITRRA